ncbi:hypothetical protein TRFO_16811 [Tritrichomonas foetus]|uniref:Uncharacterized protein n=1 Tax=Tritrichomonas foetus TaxID=1144522 RepID=A0A1J4KTQ7_9EUKA|nr:hypothetical protein TRFO_16811 [Tritrichomonas foetus]|eukprot:OHT13148.1 hypothetical protein TRFO_16811 [Tritrichomonas foetus]
MINEKSKKEVALLDQIEDSFNENPKNRENIYYDSCTLPLDEFNNYFNLLLANEESWAIVLDKIYYGAKKESIKVTKEQFSLLLSIAQNSRRRTMQTALSIIYCYSKYPTDYFVTICPPDFIDIIWKFLPKCLAFKILRYCVIHIPVLAAAKLTQLNILDVILNTFNQSPHTEKYLLSTKDAIRLYISLLKVPQCNEYYEQKLNIFLNELIRNPKKYKINLLIRLIDQDEKYLNDVIQNPNFFNMFPINGNPNFSLYQSDLKLRYHLINFVNYIFTVNMDLTIQFLSTPIWQYVSESFQTQIMANRTRDTKNYLLSSIFNFLYLVGESQEGKLFLFSQKVHIQMFQLLNDSSFFILNRALKILCQIGLTDSQEIIISLIQNGLIDSITVSLVSLETRSCRCVIECLTNIERIGEINENIAFVDAIFANADLVEAILALIDSPDEFISTHAAALHARIRSYENNS